MAGVGSRGGPRSKLTPKFEETLCKLLAKGLPMAHIAERYEIDRSTLAEWRKLSPKLREAEASCEEMAVKALTDNFDKHAPWFLSRRFPDRWGNKERVEHSGQVGIAWPEIPESDSANFGDTSDDDDNK